MPTITLTDEQVIELIEQLPPERQRAVIYKLAQKTQARRDEIMTHAETQLRRLAEERGRVWDKMNEDAREEFIDDLIHEDRA